MTRNPLQQVANRSHQHKMHGEIVVAKLMNLLVIFLRITVGSALGGLGLLSADTTGTSAAEGRVQGEVDVLLGVETDDE